MDFIVSVMFMQNIMHKTKMMCDALQAEELDISGAVEEMNEVNAALAFVKFMNIDGLADFNKVQRRRRNSKRFDENLDSEFVLGIYRY